MIDIIKEHPRAVMFAVIFHLIIIIVVGVSVDWTSLTKPSGEKAPVKIVNAVAVDQKLVDDELKKIKQAEQKRIKTQKDAERNRKQAIKARKREEKKLKELKNKSKKEQEKQLVLKKKREAELKATKTRKLKAKKEKQKKAAAAAKLAEEKKRKEQFENELKNKLAAEENERQARITAAKAAKRQSEIGKYIDKIKGHVESKWITFRAKEPGKITLVRVKVIPGGEVVDARTIKSSGDIIFDADAEKAVMNASPLPIPPADTDLINEFRDFDLKIGKPE
ncbi:MAG: cell envelope integrity protein TolA [Thiohalomonadales bacterium]